MNLADAIAKWANLTPAKTAVIDTTSDRRISFAELHADINRLTRGLISRGIAKGDRVAVLSMNSIEYLTVYYACARAGFIAQPMNWRLSAEEIARIVDDGEPAIFICQDEFLSLRDDAMALLQIETPQQLEYGAVSNSSLPALMQATDADDLRRISVRFKLIWFSLYDKYDNILRT